MKKQWSIIAATAALATASVAMAQPGAGSFDPQAPYNGPAMGPRPGETAPSPPPGPRPADVVARSLDIDLAVEAARAVVASCAGFHVGVAVLDASGLPKLYYIPDGTAGSHAYTAFRKANTALLIGAPSEQINARIAADTALAAKVAASTNYVAWAGGLPIMAGGQVIGAIGVSGAEPSTKDEACAADALRQIAGRIR